MEKAFPNISLENLPRMTFSSSLHRWASSPDNICSVLHFQLPSVRACYHEILIAQKEEAINVQQEQILTLRAFIVLLYAAENFQASEKVHFSFTYYQGLSKQERIGSTARSCTSNNNTKKINTSVYILTTQQNLTVRFPSCLHWSGPWSVPADSITFSF